MFERSVSPCLSLPCISWAEVTTRDSLVKWSPLAPSSRRAIEAADDVIHAHSQLSSPVREETCGNAPSQDFFNFCTQINRNQLSLATHLRKLKI
jgi:hypothetical protein